MKYLVRILAISLFLCVPAGFPQAPPPVWQAVAQPVFDPSKVAPVSNLVLERDAIKITLTSGVIQFAQPVEGRVFAASFRGSGVLQVETPIEVEAQQLRFFTGQSPLSMEFSEAVFSFTDGTFDEIAAKVQWGGAADAALQKNYQDRTNFREDYGAELVPRLVKGVLSANRTRTALFFAEVKTADKGWVFAQMDALNPEEIAVGRWQTYGPLRMADTWTSFPRGKRTVAEAWKVPTALEDVPPDNYEISATVTSGAELRAVARFEVKSQWEGERVLNFLLDSNLRATSVKDAASGQALPFVQPAERKDRIQSYGDYISVFLPAPLAAGQTVKLEFEYAGRRVVRSMGPGVFFAQSFGWYPTRSNFAMRSNFHMTFRSPRRYAFVATGQKVSETTDGGDLVTEWKSEKPMAVAGFAFGDVKIEKAKAGEVEIEIYANRQPDDQMREILRITEGGMADTSRSSAERESSGVALGNMSPAAMSGQIATDMVQSLRVFENYFGPYPYKRLAVSTIPYSYGQGWPSLIYLSALSFMDS
ncbi:MAG TPA: hypothetical protein VGA40_08610, partial [Candidatus Acidoferrales bacterium]